VRTVVLLRAHCVLHPSPPDSPPGSLNLAVLGSVGSLIFLHPISHRSQVVVDYWTDFRFRPRVPVFNALIWVNSGVTSAGVTQSGDWRCHPYFFLKKLTTFLVIAVCKVMTFFSLSSRHISTFRPPLSSVLSKFNHIFFISFGCHPWRVSPGAVCPPPVTPLGAKALTHD